MSFNVIKGTFHVVGYSPDGDSIRFKADNASNWDSLGGKVKLNAKEHAQLRVEAIDTLETHYKKERQPEKHANAATEQLFNLLGIKNVVWNESGTRVKSADDGVDGYILSRKAERYGRPVAFLFAELEELENSVDVYLNKTLAKKSINYKLLSGGFAYPTFYDGMFYDLRDLFSQVTIKARDSKLGIWSDDMTNNFFKVNSLQDITDIHVILPKLFRRITEYIKTNNSFDPDDFLRELELKQEKVLVISVLHFTYFDKLIKVNAAGKIKLTVKPEGLVFLG